MFETQSVVRSLVLFMFLSASSLFAAEHGATIREGQIYISPDSNSQKLVNFTRGREVAILERSGKYIHVLATVDVNPDLETSRDISGWMLTRNVITQSTPDGDKLLFGEAIDSEPVVLPDLRSLPCFANRRRGALSFGGYSMATGKGGCCHAAVFEIGRSEFAGTDR